MSQFEIIRPRQVTWWQRAWESMRSITLGPWNPKDRAIARYFSSGSVSSGVLVNEQTALGVSAFWAAVTTIAGDIASLPRVLLRRDKDGGKTRFETHPLYRLLHDRPNPYMSSVDLFESWVLQALITGSGYCEIERDGVGRPVALWPLQPYQVEPFWHNNELRYRVTNPSGSQIAFEARDILHLHGPSTDGITGFDTVHMAREALGHAIAAERFGSAFFGNGSQPGGVLTPSTALSPTASENLRTAMAARYQGVQNAHRWLLAEPGMTFTPVTINPRESQLTELRVHQLREIARFFKIPVSMIGDLENSSYANHEQEVLKYYTSCLRPWLVRIEQELDAKLIAPSERALQHCEHILEGFLRADVEKRGTFYAAMLSHGVFTVNEVRRLESLSPVKGGDRPRVPMNTQFLDEEIEAEDDKEVVEPQGRKAVVLAAHRDLLVDALGRSIRRQTERARKADTTPQKLRNFVEVFFDDEIQVSIAVQTLMPSVRAWLAFINSDSNVDVVVEALVRQYFDDSKRQLLHVADIEQGETFQTGLRNLLHRWDTERPQQLADHILQHGLTADGHLTTAPPPRPAFSSTRGMSIAWKEKWTKTKLAQLTNTTLALKR